MQRTNIEWVRNPDGTQGFASNPFTGLCPVECKLPDGRVYCYGKDSYLRFKRDKRIMFWMHKLDKISKRKKPAGIFMCSTFELFHPYTKGFYRDATLGTIKACPQHRFYILTKFPQNIDREMPDNVWLGTTVTKGGDEGWSRIRDLDRVKAKLKFISFEPLLGLLNQSLISNAVDFDWFIFGRLTGHGKEHDPDKRWIESAVDYFRGYKKPVFLKNNLKELMGEPLMQEMPNEG